MSAKSTAFAPVTADPTGRIDSGRRDWDIILIRMGYDYVLVFAGHGIVGAWPTENSKSKIAMTAQHSSFRRICWHIWVWLWATLFMLHGLPTGLRFLRFLQLRMEEGKKRVRVGTA